jgi:CRP-like cAMP-binding protein
MKNFDWKRLLLQHPIFSTVRDEGRIDALLADDVSLEHVYGKDEAIVSQDETGDSLFVIGSGSAEALLEVGEGPPIHLSTMKKDDVFGEMAFFEKRSRAATVRTKEPCTVLEILGPGFQKLVDEYPDIEFRLLLKMSERLRHTNERILALHLKTVDEKLKLFNDRLETDQRVVEASLKAAQSVFDQTKIRTDEVINSAERSRSRLNTSATVVGGFVTVLVALLGLFGWKQVSDIASHAERAREMRGNMGKLLEEDKVLAGEMKTLKTEAERLNKDATVLLGSLKESVIALYRQRFLDALDGASGVDAFSAWLGIKRAGGNDELKDFLGEMEHEVVAKARPPAPKSKKDMSSVKNFISLLQQAVVDAPSVVDPQKKQRGKLDAYYLLLVYAYLTDQDDFEQKEGEFRSLATRQDALDALKKYSKNVPKETPRRPESEDLKDWLSKEAGRQLENVLNVSHLAFVSVGRD